MPTPPEHEGEFRSPAERAAARAELRRLGHFLRDVIAAASGTAVTPPWLAAQLGKPLRGHAESPDERLAMYHTVFSDELLALQDALSDEDDHHLDDDSLRAASYLARRLLAVLLDCPPGEVTHHLPAGSG
jgi:hypothetical protein